jgi:hypothetical protein
MSGWQSIFDLAKKRKETYSVITIDRWQEGKTRRTRGEWCFGPLNGRFEVMRAVAAEVVVVTG